MTGRSKGIRILLVCGERTEWLQATSHSVDAFLSSPLFFTHHRLMRMVRANPQQFIAEFQQGCVNILGIRASLKTICITLRAMGITRRKVCSYLLSHTQKNRVFECRTHRHTLYIFFIVSLSIRWTKPDHNVQVYEECTTRWTIDTCTFAVLATQ